MSREAAKEAKGGFGPLRLGRLARDNSVVESPPSPASLRVVSTVQEIEQAISRLSPEEMRAVREWLDHQLEDRMEMTDEFKGRIESSERQMAEGRRPRTRSGPE